MRSTPTCSQVTHFILSILLSLATGPFKSRGILSLTSCFSCVACGDTRKTGKKSVCEDTSRSGKGPAAPCNPAFATLKSPWLGVRAGHYRSFIGYNGGVADIAVGKSLFMEVEL